MSSGGCPFTTEIRMIAPRDSGTIALIFALMPLVFLGCDSTGAPQTSEDISIEPERKQYTLDPEAQVDFTGINISDRTLYLPVCGPDLTFIVERHEGGTWEHYSGGLCPAIYAMGYRRAVEPGASFRMAARIGETGRYRVRLSYKSNRKAEEAQDVRSEAFTVSANS